MDESAGIVAGDNVYISGLNVNIGGLVQSGYGSYSTELSAADASKVAALDAGWAANQRPLSDNEVMSNEATASTAVARSGTARLRFGIMR